MKLLTTIIASAIALFTPCSALAAHADTVTIEDMKNYLIEAEIPEIYLESISNDEIEELYDGFQNNLIVNGGTEVSYLTIDDYGVDTLSGTIKDTDMYFGVTNLIKYADYDSNRISTVKVIISYSYLNLPVWAKTDAVIVNWDSSVFTYLSNSFSSKDTTVAKDYSGHYDEHRYLSRPNEIVQGGLGYLVDLKFSTTNTTLYFKGSASFELVPTLNPMYEASSSETVFRATSINAQYRHDGGPFGELGLSISGLNISFSKDLFTYTTAASANVFYKY